MVSDESGNGVISVTNNTNGKEFINLKINEIKIDQEGGLSFINYNKSNLDDWKILSTTSRIILDEGIQKDVGIRLLCEQDKCNYDHDLAFTIDLEPSFVSGNNINDASVLIRHGYSVVYVVPAKKQNVQYKVNYNGEFLNIHNKGNTVLTLIVDTCDFLHKTNCRITERVLSGRARNIIIPDNMRQEFLTVELFNHDESFQDKIILNKVV